MAVVLELGDAYGVVGKVAVVFGLCLDVLERDDAVVEFLVFSELNALVAAERHEEIEEVENRFEDDKNDVLQNVGDQYDVHPKCASERLFVHFFLG